jgi:hypothetical protein
MKVTVIASQRVRPLAGPMTGSAKQSRAKKQNRIASSRSLSSGAHARDPVAPRNDGWDG